MSARDGRVIFFCFTEPRGEGTIWTRLSWLLLADMSPHRRHCKGGCGTELGRGLSHHTYVSFAFVTYLCHLSLRWNVRLLKIVIRVQEKWGRGLTTCVNYSFLPLEHPRLLGNIKYLVTYLCVGSLPRLYSTACWTYAIACVRVFTHLHWQPLCHVV